MPWSSTWREPHRRSVAEEGLPAGGRREVRRGEEGRRGDYTGPRGRRTDDDHDVALQHRAGGTAVGRGRGEGGGGGATLDLFAAASAEGAWTVGEVTRRARAVMEAGLPPLWVRGEVSGFKAWRSGHWYFSLRDKTAQLRCVMFAKQNYQLPAAPTDGMQVFVFA